MQRVVIVGPGGAGKSTLARELGTRTGLPVIHLDRLYWKPGWVEPPLEEFRAKQATALAGNEWIVDGNYSGSADLRLPRADVILVLNFNPVRCIARVARRTWRSHGQETQAPGCPDKLDWQFVKWIFTYRRKAWVRMHAAISQYAPDTPVVTLKTPRSVRRYVASIPGSP